MKFSPVKRIPALIACTVILVVWAIRLFRVDFFERLERVTYDMRVRHAYRFATQVATNLGFVTIDESSIDYVRTNTDLGYRAGLYWPRHIYGRLTDELAKQGARAVAFDIIFGEPRPDHPPVLMTDGTTMESDEFFGLQMKRSSNVIIAATVEKLPPSVFLTNALALADISTIKDRPEGVLRRARPFREYRQWHPLFERAQEDYGFDLENVRIDGSRLIGHAGEKEIQVPLDKDGNFSLADMVGDKLPPGMPAKAPPFKNQRVWNMGIVLAARHLGLDLNTAEIDLKHGRITLHGQDGIKRVIPVDSEGLFYVDWCLPLDDARLQKGSIQELLKQNRQRLEGQPNTESRDWLGKLVVVGSSAVGNDLNDRRATPLGPETLLVSKHWNVASSIITNRFVQRSPLWLDLLLIVLFAAVAAILTSNTRVLPASGLVLLVAVVYTIVSAGVYVQTRYWLPLVLPLTGALLMTYGSLLAWQVMFEQAEVRRVKSIFAKVVSPKIMKELLQADTLSLVGTRREVSILFTDVRGFTELTDLAQEQAAEFVRKYNLTGAAAEACFDEQARDVLATVNTYLGIVADIVIKQDGTLDKFIGDCVMAFWGAPTPNPTHALDCVSAAIEAQRTIHSLNEERAAENKRRELENKARLSAGLKPKPLLPVLMLGTGINSGVATAGLMGSQSEQKNYTVFGREVNLASRLEGLSGHGRIFISQSTYEHLRRDAPAVAASCILQGPQKIKGIAGQVQVYEVPWRAPAPEPAKRAGDLQKSGSRDIDEQAAAIPDTPPESISVNS